jgi:hypothetical protein
MLEEGVTLAEAPRCPTCGRFVGMLKWQPPYRVEMDTWGDHFGDLAFGSGCEWNHYVPPTYLTPLRRFWYTSLP